jgi:serine/threonine protein kinase
VPERLETNGRHLISMRKTSSKRAKQELVVQHAALIEQGLRSEAKQKASTEASSSGGVTPVVLSVVQFGMYILLPEQEIGHGSYGKVVMAKERTTQRRVALKVFGETDEAVTEVNMYKILMINGGHRCVLPLLGEGVEPPTPWMALPYIPGQNLRGVLMKQKDLSIDARTGIVTQLVDVLTWLHGQHVVHLDLKPGNLLWNPYDRNLVLIDFGMALECLENGMPSKVFKHGIATEIEPFNAVTANYRPPELWKGMVTSKTVCWPIDVWSFGCTMVEVYAGEMLMHGQTDRRILPTVELWVDEWSRKCGRSTLIGVPSHLRNVAWFCCAPKPINRPRMSGDLVAWALRLPPCPMKC